MTLACYLGALDAERIEKYQELTKNILLALFPRGLMCMRLLTLHCISFLYRVHQV